MRGLAKALRERMRMLRDDALAVAKVVEEAFQGGSELDDDRLDPHLRQVFYDLQDARILDVTRREYEADGRTLRGYRWHLLDVEIDAESELEFNLIDPVVALYDDLRDAAWERRPATATQD